MNVTRTLNGLWTFAGAFALEAYPTDSKEEWQGTTLALPVIHTAAMAGRERPQIKSRDGGAGIAGGTGSRYLDSCIEHSEGCGSSDQRICYWLPLH